MMNVMAVDVAFVAAAGKTTALISGIKSAFERGWNAASFSTHIERITLLVFGNPDDAAITSEAAGGFGGKRWAIFKLRAAMLCIDRLSTNGTKSFSVNMHDDLVLIAAAHFFNAMGEKAFSNECECVGAFH